MKITIDAGHGAKGNQYPPQPKYYEGTQMWKLSQYLAAELQKYGATVVTTRPSVTDDPEVYIRGATAAKNGSDMILSLHSNAAADTSVRGTETYYSVKGSQYQPLASKLALKVAEIMGHHSRGAKTRTIVGSPNDDYYGVIRGAANNGCVCAIILEHGFHTNAKDAAFLVQDDNLRRLAAVEAEIISSYFGLKTEQPATLKPSGTPIMGASTLTAEQMSAYLLSKNPAPLIKCTPLELARFYIDEGNAEGVRGDIAFCQAIQETGWFRFGKDVLPEQNNYCGLGATGNGVRGDKFTLPQLGVRSHIQHLKAYACTDSLRYTCVDPRFKYVTRGIAPTFEQLGGKWAIPGYDPKTYSSFDAAYANGDTYGQKILRIFADMSAFKAVAPPKTTIMADDKVKVLNAVTYDGGTFRVYYPVYDVLSVSGDRAVIGIDKTTTAAVNVKNLQKA